MVTHCISNTNEGPSAHHTHQKLSIHGKGTFIRFNIAFDRHLLLSSAFGVSLVVAVSEVTPTVPEAVISGGNLTGIIAAVVVTGAEIEYCDVVAVISLLGNVGSGMMVVAVVGSGMEVAVVGTTQAV